MRCIAIMKNGQRCKRSTTKVYCSHHKPNVSFISEFSEALVNWLLPIIIESKESDLQLPQINDEIISLYLREIETLKEENIELRTRIEKDREEILKSINDKLNSIQSYQGNLNQKSDNLLKLSNSVSKQIEMTHNILVEFTAEQKHSLNEIYDELESLNELQIQNEFKEIKELVDSLLKEMMNNTKELELSRTISSKMNNPKIGVKHKLKFILPLIFLRYEGELELGQNKPVPTNLKDWKKLFIKNK